MGARCNKMNKLQSGRGYRCEPINNSIVHTIIRICVRNRDSTEEEIGVGQGKLHRRMRFDLSHEGQITVFRHLLIWKWGRVRRMGIRFLGQRKGCH